MNYLDILFNGGVDETEAAAGLEKMAAEEAARVAALKARDAEREAAKLRARCPKCAGSGYLSQFAHRKGGECFTCGGTGVFSRA